jgi:hypothetical protein
MSKMTQSDTLRPPNAAVRKVHSITSSMRSGRIAMAAPRVWRRVANRPNRLEPPLPETGQDSRAHH